MSKELECLDRIDKRNYLTEREHKEFLGVVEKALTEYEAIKNAEPTKAMECLETIWCDISTNYINEYVVIKQALQRLESIDNANPSEALKCLNKIVESFNETTTGMYGLGEVVVANDLIYGFKEELDTIKQALIQAEQDKKKAECWDIAMAKGWRVVADVITHKNYCDYIDYIKNYDKKLFNSEYRLTKEEFNTLKEGLK